MKKQTILITGGTGFLGSRILEALLNQNYRVILVKRSTSSLWRIENFIKKVIVYDIDDIPLEQIFEEQSIDIVFHTACEYGRNDKLIQKVVESNLIFGLKILDACIKFNIKTFFNTDTSLNRNLSEYTLSKKQFTEWLKLKSRVIQIINLRIELIYGPKDDPTKFIPYVISQLKLNTSVIKLTSGEQERDFIYIDDVVEACMILLEKSPTLTKFNEFDVGTGKSVKVKFFLEQLKKIFETNFGVVKTKFTFGKIPLNKEKIVKIKINNKPLIELGWSPKTDIQSGLIKVCKY